MTKKYKEVVFIKPEGELHNLQFLGAVMAGGFDGEYVAFFEGLTQPLPVAHRETKDQIIFELFRQKVSDEGNQNLL